MFNKKIILILTIVFASLLTVSAVSAADNTTSDVVSVEQINNEVLSIDNVTDNVVSVDGTNDKLNFALDDGSFKDLNDDISNAVGELNLNRDYVFDSTTDSSFSSGITINKQIVINGNGHNILAESKSKAFIITSNNVILKNINFYDCYSGAITWKGDNGNLINCKFEDCKPNDSTVRWTGNTGLISNCIFKSCSSYDEGGALYLQNSNEFKIEGCEFINNKVTNYHSQGGAVFINNANVSINNCLFEKNTADFGGAIYCGANKYSCSINNSRFINNSNTAVWWVGNNFNLANSIFKDNLNVKSEIFYPNEPINGADNTLNACGGALYIYGNNTRISNSIFNNNKVSSSMKVIVDYSGTPGIFFNIREKIYANSYGGAIYLNGNKFYLDNISCSNNFAYSSSYIDVQLNRYENDWSLYEYAYANSYGGAIYLNGGGILSNSFFSENNLDGSANVNRGIIPSRIMPIGYETSCYGGGVYWNGYSRDNLVNNSIFIQNKLKLDNYGSAIYLKNFKGDINFNTFLENQNKVIDSSESEFSADYNWWGNTVSNYNQKLLSNELGVTKWLFLNMESNISNLKIDDNAVVTLDLSNVYDSSSNSISHLYGVSNINFNLKSSNVKCNSSNVIIKNGVAKIGITAQNYGQGSLTASYYGINSTVKFTISKKASKINIQINNCTVYKNELIAYLNITPNTSGSLKIYLNNDLYSSINLIKTSNHTLNINLTGLNSNNYTLNAVYAGDNFYLSSSNTINFEVQKAQNNMVINHPSLIDYGEVIKLNINKNDVTDGTLFIQIKNKENTLIYNHTHNIVDINNITLPIIDVGVYTLLIDYESVNYQNVHFDSNFTINKVNPIISKCIVNTVYGKSEMLFNSSVDGVLTIILSNNLYKTFNIESNIATTLNLSDIDVGDYDVEYIFVPNNQNYYNSTTKSTLTIFKTDPTFRIDINDINYKETAILNINYLNSIVGFANITISGDNGFEFKFSNVNLNKGSFNKELSNLNASKYTILFEYGGNNNYYPITLYKTFNVFKIDPTISIDITDAIYGQTAKIIVYSNAEGNVTIIIGSVKTYDNVLIKDNRVLQNIDDLDVGTYTVKTVYNGNDNYNAKVAESKLTIYKSSENNVVATVDDIYYSQDAIINVKSNVDGIAVVKIDEKYIENIDVMTNNLTQVTFKNIPAGKHNVTITLKPTNTNYNESVCTTEFTVLKKETKIDLNVVDSIYGQDVIFNVTASEDGKVILKVGDITRERNVLANIQTKFNLGVLAVNAYNVEVSFDAGENYNVANKQSTFSVTPAKSEISSIQAQNNIYGENTIINVKTNVSGVLTVKINNNEKTFNIDANKLISLDLDKYDAGTYNIDLSLDAGANYTQATGNTKVTINPKQTAVSLDVNNEVYGNNVIVKVTASENGKVTVRIGNIVKSVNVDANKVTSVDFGILDVNSYEVTATFDGGKNFNTSSDKDSFEISPKASSVTFVNLINNYIYSNNVVVNVKSDVAGTVTVKVGDKTQTKQITAGNVVSFDFGILDVNKYDVLVSLNTGSNYISSQNTASITISPKSTVVTLNTKDYDADEKVIVNVTASENGKATIKLGNVIKNVDVIANKIASVDFGVLSTGSYDVVGTFVAGNNYIDSSDSANIKVLAKIDEKDINITVPELKPNQENNIVINLPADATGTVTLIIGENAYTFDVKNGIANINVPKLDEGNYEYVINYSGDSKYSSFENTGSIDVAKPDPEIVIPPLDEPSEDGSLAIKFPNDAAGIVTLVINGKAYSFPVVNGVANVYMPDLANGNYVYTITYSGDSKYSSFTKSANMTVNNIIPTVITVKGITAVYNGGKNLVITLEDYNGNVVTDAYLIMEVNKNVYLLQTDKNGLVEVSTGFVPSAYLAKISMADTRYSASDVTTKFIIKKATPKLTAAKKTFKKSVKTKQYTVTLKDNNNKVMKNTYVTLKVNKKTYKVKTNSKGQAKFKITNLNKKGTFTAVVKYAGNSCYNAKTVKPKITVK